MGIMYIINTYYSFIIFAFSNTCLNLLNGQLTQQSTKTIFVPTILKYLYFMFCRNTNVVVQVCDNRRVCG